MYRVACGLLQIRGAPDDAAAVAEGSGDALRYTTGALAVLDKVEAAAGIAYGAAVVKLGMCVCAVCHVCVCVLN